MARPRPSRARRSGNRPRRRLAAVSVLGLAALALQPAGGASAAPRPAPVHDPASLVNPIIGTSGAVNTFPGPDMPTGMMQWGPDTTPHRTPGGGYEYDDKKLSGYSLTHISGPGCGVAGDLPILPVTGKLPGDPSAAATAFDHDHEKAAVGSYKLTDSSGVTTELTDTTRSGVGRFTFPSGKQSHLLLKLSGGATQVDGTRIRAVSDHEVSGAVDSGHFCGAANRYTLHFDITFDRPFATSGTWNGTTVHSGNRSLRAGRAPAPAKARTAAAARHGTPQPTASSTTAPTLHGKAQPDQAHPDGKSSPPKAPHPDGKSSPPRASHGKSSPPTTGANGMYLTFDTAAHRTVTAKVGISYTSDAGATANLRAEAAHHGFDAVRAANHRAWNKVLGRVRVAGGSRDAQVKFYTALYHSLLHPNVFSDVDGRYMGMDDQVHRLKHGQRAQYANYSGWDTYRSQTQLMAMVEPDVTSDVVTSMLNGYDQIGIMPKWASNNGESYVMVGDPAAAIIADAYAFGARRFDTRHALDAMIHEATKPNQDRPGQDVRDAKGYLPLDKKDYGCCNFYGAASTQLEYDSADYALASFAKSLGRKDVYEKFATRAQDWMNIFNPQTGYIQGRDSDGRFAGGFTPGTSNGFVEGTSAQYTPMVPFNVEQLAAARGGTGAYSSYLDSLLTDVAHPGSTTADLSNEPSVEIPWEYNYLGQPWKTQAAVRETQQKLYFNKPVGSFGNDDLGAMSSWYVWSELGMYPETPGTDTLVLGSPGFPSASVALGGSGHGSRTLRISAPKAADNAPYVQSLGVGGKAWKKSWLTFDQVRRAGHLDYALGTSPNKAWASGADAAPPSDTTGGDRVLAAAGPSGDGLVLQPNGTGKGTLTLTNLGGKPVTADWKAAVPDGVTLDHTSGTVTVPARGRAEAHYTVKAGADEGARTVDFALTDHSGGAKVADASLRVAVAGPGELWPYASNQGVQPDGAKFSGGFDDGGWAYSKEALAAAGASPGKTVTADGVSYTWPEPKNGQGDNVVAAGQKIAVPDGTSGSALGLLGAATNAPTDGSGTGGTVTVTYTDGSTAKKDVTFSDWTLNGGSAKPLPGDTTALTTDHRNTGSGKKDNVDSYVFAVQVPLTAGKTIASVTLPNPGGSGAMHVFALGFGK